MKVGDRVVCVKTHSRSELSGVIKDKIYTIYNTIKCQCGRVGFDIGAILPLYYHSECSCGRSEACEIIWIDSTLFAPIQRKSDEFLSSDKIEKSAEERIDIKLPVSA